MNDVKKREGSSSVTPKIVGWSAFVLFFLVGGFLSIIISLSSAIILPGSLVIQGDALSVQHEEGGVIEDILVYNGDLVEKGEPLIKLDSTLIDIEIDRNSKLLSHWMARTIRLSSELDISSDEVRKENHIQDPFFERSLQEESLFQEIVLRKNKEEINNITIRQSILKSKYKQTKDKLKTLQKQELLAKEQTQRIYNLSKSNYTSQYDVSEKEQDELQITLSVQSLEIELKELQQSIEELESQKKLVLAQLDEIRIRELLNIKEKMIETEYLIKSLKQRKKGLFIFSPETGTVHNLQVNTLGGTVSPSQTLVEIVPYHKELIIKAKVDPTLINEIFINQEVLIRFPSLHSTQMTEVTGEIKLISADLIHDLKAQKDFYEIEVQPNFLTTLEKSFEKQLISGAPVELFIQTGKRSFLSYLLRPIKDIIRYTFREN